MQPLSLTGRFITLAALRLDPVTHEVTLVNAGHPAPLVLRRATGLIEDVDPPATGGPPLGAVPVCEYRACEFALHPGDGVVLFSDGVTEALDAAGRQLGTDGLRAVVGRGPGGPRELGERVLNAVETHAAGCEPHDDTTLVCFGREIV
jgi:serine phosphatase RsbU (regulator of sigma subunit)